MFTGERSPVASGDAVDEPVDEFEASPALRQWRWLLPLAVVASTAAWLAGFSSGQTQGAARVALMVGGAILTAVASGVPLWQHMRASRERADAISVARRARAAMRVSLEDALDPFVALLLQLSMADGMEKAQLRGEAIQLTVTTIAHLSGSPRIRVCYFAFDPGPPPRLTAERYAGRFGAPTAVLDDTTPAGRQLLAIVADGGGWQVGTDARRRRPASWWDEDHAYRAFAVGPVTGPSGPLGLLTLDALRPGELDELDLPLIRLLADLLALALRM